MRTLTRSTYAGPIPNDAFVIVADWLAENGIDEAIPDNPTFQVDQNSIFYRAFQFRNDERGYNPNKIKASYLGLLTEDRVVPLLAPPSTEVRNAFASLDDGHHRAALDWRPNSRCTDGAHSLMAAAN